MTTTGYDKRVHSKAVPIDDERELAITHLRRQRKFGQDAITYVGVNGMLWLIWALTDHSIDGGLPWPAWISLIWGFFLAIDAWKAFGRWPSSLRRPIDESEIEREIARLRH